MQNNLRLVIIDYPKLLLENPTVNRIFGDLIAARQKNYIRASPEYVSLGPLDAVSTHFIVVDGTDLYNPKVAAGMRLSYSHRAQKHKLRLSADEHVQFMPELHQARYKKFRSERPIGVQLGGLFVDPFYSYKKTNIKLVELVYFAGIFYLVRKGFDHYIGESNEKFKVSKIVRDAGHVKEDLAFTHPEVNETHKLLLFERLSYDWIWERVQLFGGYLSEQIEYQPAENSLNETSLSVAAAIEIVELGGPDIAQNQPSNLKNSG